MRRSRPARCGYGRRPPTGSLLGTDVDCTDDPISVYPEAGEGVVPDSHTTS